MTPVLRQKKLVALINKSYPNTITGIHACILLFTLLIIFSCNDNGITGKTGNKKVEIKNENGVYRLYKNGSPLLVKGAVGYTHLSELAACGSNTVMIWDTTLLEQTLNDAAKNNISVIAGLDVPSGEYIAWYQDKAQVDKQFAAYEKIVNKYKSYPALLAWSLGNELLMPINSQSSYFYKTYNRFLNMIHQQDPDHPVTTTIINYNKQSILNIRWKIRKLDFISINTYNRIKDLNVKMKKLEVLWNGPFLISEWCPNGGWEAETTVWGAPLENTSTKKAEQYYEYYKNYMPVNNKRFLGSMAFYWGNRHEYTHTWYSVYGEDGIATEVKEALADCWRGTKTKHEAAQVQYMLIDSMGKSDNIILSPGSKHIANLILSESESKDSLRYSWEVLKEDWYSWGRTWHYFKRPSALQGLIADSNAQKTTFICPTKEGPYRIFINVYNKKGYCTTANIPFYVVNNEL